MTAPLRIVIAGAGLAGLRAAQAARQAGHDGELILIGDEPHAPYTRPPLSKELLRGEQTDEQCAFPGVDALDATRRQSISVTGIDPAVHTVTLSTGESLAYDRLIIATGVRPMLLGDRTTPGREPGATRGGLGYHRLRSLSDAERLRDALSTARRMAIVGAGFIGCEVAASARSRGIEVVLIDQAPGPLVPIGRELGGRVARLHADHGVELRLGAGVEARTDSGVALTDGTRVDADLVLVAIGARPDTGWLGDSGIELAADGGIACDATLTSVSDPDVLAAGDVASWPHPGAGGEPVRVEHWTTAAEHGKVAGANATRDPADRGAHVAPPYFWSDQYDVKVQSVGFPARAAEITIVEEDPDADATAPRLVAECLDAAGELVGAVTFNHARRLTEYRRRLIADHA